MIKGHQLLVDRDMQLEISALSTFYSTSWPASYISQLSPRNDQEIGGALGADNLEDEVQKQE